MNAKVGKTPTSNIIGAFGENINKKGKVLRKFAIFTELKITFFKNF